MTIYVIDLESVPTRYTCEWKDHVPNVIRDYLKSVSRVEDVINIEGDQNIPAATTPGAFLNFGGTNMYKSSQAYKIAQSFTNGFIKPGDQFVFTDGWNPTIIQIKYMSELLNIPVKIHSFLHAGSWDPQDFLGRLIKDKSWVKNFERSIFYAADYSYFATNFHIDMFCSKLDIIRHCGRIIRTGWPMEYMADTLKPYAATPKEDIILFPHRIAPEKQVEIFRDLATQMPQYKFIVCQDQQLTKKEYHQLLGKAKIVFSANLQETLGISTCLEGPLANCIPLAPSRLSYIEIFKYNPEFTYPAEWTKNFGSYLDNRHQLKSRISTIMTAYDQYCELLKDFNHIVIPEYFSCDAFLRNI